MFRVFFAALLLNQQRVKCGAIPERAVSSVVERLVYTQSGVRNPHRPDLIFDPFDSAPLCSGQVFGFAIFDCGSSHHFLTTNGSE